MNVFNKIPLFGDHTLVVVELIYKEKPEIKSRTVRNWKNYTTLKLQCKLAAELILVNYNPNLLSVQEHWSVLENVMINVIDDIAPLTSSHIKCKKSTPSQITLYQSALKLHRTLNENLDNLNFEQITVFNQMICTGRQTNFQITRNNCFKIGMNTTSNKFYSLNNLIGLDRLNMAFVHFKKLAKIQFLKYGKT